MALKHYDNGKTNIASIVGELYMKLNDNWCPDGQDPQNPVRRVIREKRTSSKGAETKYLRTRYIESVNCKQYNRGTALCREGCESVHRRTLDRTRLAIESDRVVLDED